MLRMDSTNMNFNGTSVVGEYAVANMSASFNGGQEIYFSLSVLTYDMYKNNKDIVEADFSTFCDEVVEAISISK